MDFRFSQFEILTAAGTLLLCLYFVSVFSEVSAIEGELAEQVTAVLETEDLYWSGVEISGQHLTLTGAVPDVPARNSIVHQLGQLSAVTSIDNQLQIIGEEGTCQQNIDEYLAKERITFKSGNATLTQDSHDVLGMLAMILRQCGTRVEIAGHTDAKGDSAVNLALSQRRSEMVAKRLAQLGVAVDAMTARGYGESQPVADNSNPEGRVKNRRIEFRVLGDNA